MYSYRNDIFRNAFHGHRSKYSYYMVLEMTNRFPQDGPQREDIERLLMPNAHDFPDTIKFPVKHDELHVIADCRDREVMVERGSVNVIVKESEINGLVAMLLKAKDLFGECNGK